MAVHTSPPGIRPSADFDDHAAWIRSATELRRAGRLVESENMLRLVLPHATGDLEARIALAHVLYRQERRDEADAVIAAVLAHDSIAFDPGAKPLVESLLVAAVDLAELLRRLGRGREADAIITRIMGMEPENEALHRQFGMLLLRCGDFKHGWQERDRRVSSFQQPAWSGQLDGGSLAGKTILVQALHGYGDTIQFVRLLPLVKARGARVILEHQPALATLLQGAEGWDALVARHTGQEALVLDFDLHLPLMSLPVPLGIEDRIPATVPYLHPDPTREHYWKERLAAQRGCRVGLVWAGSPDFTGDKNRSCHLADYAWLARLPEVQFYSLQHGQAAEQAGSAAAAKMGLIDLAPELPDFADTAAAIMNLDLVITVDTSVAHLAGALGRPVWTLLPYHCCWRWMEARADSPWYPTMRLFRQSRRGDWATVLQSVISELDRYRTTLQALI